jgi:integrase
MASLIKRGNTYYAQYSKGGKIRRRSLETTNLQVAKEKVRQLESALARRDEIPIPTKTLLPDILTDYVQHIRQHKTRNSVKSDLFYLRQAFGPVIEELKTPIAKQDDATNRIDYRYLEDIQTEDVARLIATQVQRRGLKPKSANRYREVLHTLFSWAMNQRGVKMPGDRNPVTKVARYKEKAPEIVFLTLEQIDRQLEALAGNPLIQTMVAVYIYAGLRREEVLWLTRADVDLKSGPYGMLRVCAKTVHGEHWEPKTKRNRVVPISRSLRQYLDRYEQRIVPGHLYFPSSQGRRWDADNFSRALRNANHAAGLRWSCAHYRHTFASHLAMRGLSLYQIAALLGNSPDICRRHYAALVIEKFSDCVDFATINRRTPTGLESLQL